MTRFRADEDNEEINVENYNRRADDARVAKLYKDVFIGDGMKNPSITTRLALIEDIIGKLTWVAGITLSAVIGEIVLRVMKIL